MGRRKYYKADLATRHIFEGSESHYSLSHNLDDEEQFVLLLVPHLSRKICDDLCF